jgi:hypothetical protein
VATDLSVLSARAWGTTINTVQSSGVAAFAFRGATWSRIMPGPDWSTNSNFIPSCSARAWCRKLHSCCWSAAKGFVVASPRNVTVREGPYCTGPTARPG